MKSRKILCVMCLCVLLLGCGSEEAINAIENAKMINSRGSLLTIENRPRIELTLEYVCSEFGIDESEFEGVDFDEFVEYYSLTYENIHDEAVKFLLSKFKENYGKLRIPNYHEMFSKGERVELTKDNQGDIKVVEYHASFGDINEFYIFDFDIEKTIISCSDAYVLEEEIVGMADASIKEKIIDLFEEHDVYSWVQSDAAYEYLENSYENSGGPFKWSITIKFMDETMYWIFGYILIDETNTETYEAFVEDLKALAESVPEE